MIKQKFSKRKTSNTKENKKGLYIGIGIFTPILLVYLIFSFYYSSHFYSHTKINGVSTSNMTVKEAEESINAQVKSYVLTIKGRNDINDSIYGKNIDLHAEVDGNLDDTLSKQNGFAWPISIFKAHTIKVKAILNYDEALMKKQIGKLNCLKEANNVEPVNAHVSEYGKNGYEIVSEVQGSKVNKKKLYELVNKSVMSLASSLSLEKEKCYEEPVVNSKNKNLSKALDEMNKIAGAKITYKFGDATEILDGSTISKWLSVDENFKVDFDKQGIKDFVDYIGRTYNSFGRIRTFQTSYKKVIKVKGGDYGWWLDRVTEVSNLSELVMNGKQQNRKPAYFQTAQQYGNNDIGDTYVEVNLTAQHLFFYKDGKLIFQSDFVSGNVSKKLGTPVGTYPIQYKESDATLKGENYATPVKYWMPFNGNIGLHDADWRDEFGKDIYLTNGSHGCINMPPANAKKLFANISKGVAVVVYKLKGTENYEKKEPDKAADKTIEQTTNKTTNKTTSETMDTSKKNAQTKKKITPVPTKKVSSDN